MAFQIKDFTSIAASMINWMKSTTQKITDFNIGSIARSLVEAPAAEIDELYQQMFIGLKEAIPVSVYNSFDFELQDATPAAGPVRVVITSSADNVLISAGTKFSIAGSPMTYESTADYIIASGDTFADVSIVADSAGSSGNIAVSSDFSLSPPPDNFVSATNLSAFINGRDDETPDERKLRFNEYISTISRGTVAALRYGLKTTRLYDPDGNEIERVKAAEVVEPWILDDDQPISLVLCYIHNGVGDTSVELVARAAEVIYGYYEPDGTAVPGWKAGGVKVNVFAATEEDVAVTGVLTATSGYDVDALIDLAETVIYSYILALDIGKDAIRAEIISRVMEIEGVFNFVPSLPATDTTADANVKLMPGAITITPAA